MTIGKVYDVHTVGKRKVYYRFADDYGDMTTGHKKYFITLEEHRRDKLNDILNTPDTKEDV